MFNTGLIWGVSWVWYLVGTIGIGGTVLLAYLAPAALFWLLRFFVSTRIGVGLAVGALAFMGADIHRSRLDEAAFTAKLNGMIQAQRDREAKIAQQTKDEVWLEIANQTATNTGIDRDVKDFHDALPPIPHLQDGSSPTLVGGASCRLRELAGYPGCEPGHVGPAPVPKARPHNSGPRSKHWSQLGLPGLITRGSSRASESK